MTARKESRLSFPTRGKESIQERLRQLFRGRSLRKVSTEWGLPYSTLNNYFTKGTMPSVDAIASVAEVERVSLEWLITGETQPHQPVIQNDNSIHSTPASPLRDRWMAVYDSLDTKDTETLLRLIYSRGVLGIISLAGMTSDLDKMFNDLPEDEKKRLMALHEAKKGASEDGELDITPSPASDNKRQAS